MYCQAAFLLSRLCRQQDPSQLPNLLLADFGVAKIATTSKLSGTVRGTLEYMAPEQIEGAPSLRATNMLWVL